MKAMHSSSYTEARNLLQKSLKILSISKATEQTTKLKSVTLNNLGCLYKRIQNYPKALQYLTAALEIGNTLSAEVTNKAGAHLNICAIKSALNYHEQALNHALTAIQLLKLKKAENAYSLVVAYHASGLEYQFLNFPLKAVSCFDQGYEIAVQKLGKMHPLTVNLEKSIKDYHGYRRNDMAK